MRYCGLPISPEPLPPSVVPASVPSVIPAVVFHNPDTEIDVRGGQVQTNKLELGDSSPLAVGNILSCNQYEIDKVLI